MTVTLLQTPLHAWHAEHGARLVDFAGWSMPVHYGSIVAEHQATRGGMGLFDVSHMGRLQFRGAGAATFLDSLVSRQVTDMSPGQVRYGLVTNEAGGILDDVLVYRLPGSSDAVVDADESSHLMVVNASNRAKILSWIDAQIGGHADVEPNDATDEMAMIAVQGPRTLDTLQPFVAGEIGAMKYYHCRQTTIDGSLAIVSRTGYTGEDGFEVMIAADAATSLWQKLLDAGRSIGAMACGLGCRDTLRLEAAMPLYGHELNEEITPWQAGLDFAVDLEGRTFPGREELSRLKQTPQSRVRVGLVLSGKRVPREHFPILSGSRVVGEVTSGTFSPTLNQPIAMGYVDRDHVPVGTELTIDIRGTAEAARVVKLPFYRRPRK